MPDMGLYYYESEEAFKTGEQPKGRVELLGVEIELKNDPKTDERIIILDSIHRELKLKDDPDDDDDINIADWIPDLEEIIRKQNADPSTISPFVASTQPVPDIESGSPAALESSSVPIPVGDSPDPA